MGKTVVAARQAVAGTCWKPEVLSSSCLSKSNSYISFSSRCYVYGFPVSSSSTTTCPALRFLVVVAGAVDNIMMLVGRAGVGLLLLGLLVLSLLCCYKLGSCAPRNEGYCGSNPTPNATRVPCPRLHHGHDLWIIHHR